jgi:hypothetical protein
MLHARTSNLYHYHPFCQLSMNWMCAMRHDQGYSMDAFAGKPA